MGKKESVKALTTPWSSATFIKKWKEYAPFVSLTRSGFFHKLSDHVEKRLIKEAPWTSWTMEGVIRFSN